MRFALAEEKILFKKNKTCLERKITSKTSFAAAHISIYIPYVYIFFSFTRRVIRDDVEIAIGAAGQRTNKE